MNQLFSTKAVAELIADPGEDLAAAATMVRGLVQRRLVLHRGLKGSGRTAHQQFSLEDILAAKVLRSLTLHGIADNAASAAASSALYDWIPEDYAAGRVEGAHPVSAALARFRKGEEWLFRLASFSISNGKRIFIASLYGPDFFPRVEGVMQACTWVETRPFIQRISRLLEQGASA